MEATIKINGKEYGLRLMDERVENQNGDHRCDCDPELDIVECRYESYKFIRL